MGSKAGAIFLNLGLLFSSVTSIATIYGDDDFVDVLLSKNQKIIQASRSVAVQMMSYNVLLDQILQGRTLLESSICKNERFVKQKVNGNCTAFLVAPDVLLTASHCMMDNACGKMKWVFDYAVDSKSAVSAVAKTENVFSCSNVITSHYSENLDYAFIKLDRVVENREALVINFKKTLSLGQELASIGSPRGLPLKFSKGKIRNLSGVNSFTHTTDLMHGSSGGPLFDLATWTVVGIVVQGEVDYVADFSDSTRMCNAFLRCGENECRGEEATRINQLPVSVLNLMENILI